MQFTQDHANRLNHLFDILVGERDDPHILRILLEMRNEMSALSDAVAANTAAVADNTTATHAAVAKITALPGAPSDAADVQAAVDALGTNTAATQANTAALNAAQPAPAA